MLLLLGSCQQQEGHRVKAADYDSFFLWPGVHPPPAVAKARCLYLLAGEVRKAGVADLTPLRATPHIPQAEVWMTIRVERLDWSTALTRQILANLARWENAGNQMAGLQIDFDAATKGLDDYAAFLTALRTQLPPRYRLSVTGLMDWSAHGDPAALARLGGVVDEAVIQTYQGRQTIPGYAAYFPALAQLPVPHKVGLVEGGEWQEPAELSQDKLLKGYVVFLTGR